MLIVDPATRLCCAADRVGEIWIQGDSVAAGYWNDAAATQRRFQARLADSDDGPFLRTGDLGFMQEGQLHVTGRLGDLVLIGGTRFYPGDIEAVVRSSHPGLLEGEAAAFSIGSRGERRLIVLHELERRRWRTVPHASLEHAARSALRARLGVDLQKMILLPEGALPKTASGKVRRNASRDAYLRRRYD